MSESTKIPRPSIAGSPPTQASPIPVETNAIASSLRSLVIRSASLNELIRGVSELICRETECLAIWVAQREQQSGSLQIQAMTDSNASAVAEVIGSRLNQILEQTLVSGELGSVTVNENHTIVASAVGVERNQFEMALAGCFVSGNQSNLRQQWMLALATQTVEQWLRQSEINRSRNQSKFITEALSLCGVMDRSKSKQEAANYLVNHIRRLLGVSQVIYCDGLTQEEASLTAISEIEQFDPHSESSKITLSAARLGIGECEPLLFSSNSQGPDAVHNLAFEAYCKANRYKSCACMSTLDHEENPTGSILIADSERDLTETQLTQLKQFATVNGTHLDVVRRANLGPADVFKEKLRRTAKQNWFKIAWKSAIVVAVLMCIPIPYRVACDCEIQPVTRRFVSAPYTGPLERSIVRPGEVVSKDQVLAYMDGQQLRLKLTGVIAEKQAARRKHSSALAQGEVAQSQIARSEIRKLDSQIESLEDQLSRLEIRSPCDGIVISGDLDKAQGATMEIGQTLFEVAPLDAMLAEVAIPESEIQYVNDTNTVSIKLNAFPYRTFSGSVDTIHPSAEVLNDESVFVADVKLNDEETVIRPGMKGTAKVKTSWSPIGWNLFHNAWESVRCWTVW